MPLAVVLKSEDDTSADNVDLKDCELSAPEVSDPVCSIELEEGFEELLSLLAVEVSDTIPVGLSEKFSLTEVLVTRLL